MARIYFDIKNEDSVLLAKLTCFEYETISILSNRITGVVKRFYREFYLHFDNKKMLSHSSLLANLQVKDTIMKDGGTVIVQPTRAYVEIIAAENVNGMNKESIDELPNVEYHIPTQCNRDKDSKNTIDESDKERTTNFTDCSICLEQFSEGDTVKKLKCKHIFHPECIQQWLSKEASCPLCRKAQEPRLSKETFDYMTNMFSNMIMFDNRFQ